MLKGTKKIVAMLLVLLMMFSLTIGCSPKDSGDNDTNSNDDTSKNDEQQDVEEPETYDFGGRTITFSCNWDAEPKPNSSEGEDKLLARIAEIEEKYNVKIAYLNVPYDQYLENYSASIMAGDPMAEVANLNSSWFYPSLVTKGFLYPLSDLEAFDFTEDKWNQDIIKASTYEGKVYGFNTGRTYPSLGLFFNKDIFEREGLGDLYELQRNGTWTWEKMAEIAQQATKDTDGDGKIDQWGLGGFNLEWAFVYSNAAEISKEIDGKETFSLTEPNAIEALNELQKFYQTYQVIEIPPEGAAWDYPIQQFQDGRTAMFAFDWYIAGRYHTDMADKYGYVMFPKGPQANDYVAVATSFGVNSIASTVDKPEEVAIVWNHYTEPFPDEDEYAWKEEFEELSWDRETVDETINMMRVGKTTFSKISSFSDLQNMMWGVIPAITRGEKTASQAIEEIAVQAQAAIDDVLSDKDQE